VAAFTDAIHLFFSCQNGFGFTIMSRFASAFSLFWVMTLAHFVCLTPTASAQPLDWVERYALANDREAVLSELIPGSEEHYFYHCLHYQVSGQIDKAEALLTQWKADQRTRHSGYLQGIEDRQRLLTYKVSPDRTADYLRDRLNLNFHHSAPTAVGQLLYPSTYDNAFIGIDRLIDAYQIELLTPLGLQTLAAKILAGKQTIDADRLAALLNRVDGPWMKDLDKLVIKELQSTRADQRTFGDRIAHEWLTLSELQAVAKAVPAVAYSQAMVTQTLLRLRPSDDEDMRQQPSVRRQYLERLESYVNSLPDAYISLKAATLHQRLQHDLTDGVFDRERFLRYLRMPRFSAIVPPLPVRSPRAMAELGQDFSDLAVIPPIGDEQPLVRTYLEHFLKESDSSQAFDGLLKPDYLRTVFAETKLLAGSVPAERWYAMLDPSRRQEVRDRVELTLAATNPRIHDAKSPSSLIVDLKRVDNLVVRIYRINTHSFYRTRTTLIDTDVDLDGLIPTYEQEIKYSFAPTLRHRETIPLPQLEGRGVWIVDLLGGGLRARAMVRRGELFHAITQSPNGVRITAIDEDRKPVAGAKLVIASRELVANEQGQIDIPPLDQQVTRDAVLHDLDLATPIAFPHVAEKYSLQAAWYIDHQQLQTGKETDFVVRTRLLMSDKPIDPIILKDVHVIVTATDLDGIATTKRFEKLKLDQAGELALSLRVPPRLVRLDTVLTGKVPGLAKNELIDLTASHSWDVATMRKTTATSTAHLTRSNDRWIIETRGRGGESIAGAVVHVTLHPSVRSDLLHATLQSNAEGFIDLGPLQGIDSIEITSGNHSSSKDLRTRDAVWPSRLHLVAGTDVHLPLPSSDAPLSRFRMVSLRAGERPETDHSGSLLTANGRLKLKQIAGGNYYLHDLETGHRLLVCVTSGPILEDVAVGEIRQLDLAPRSELGIDSIERVADTVKIKLVGSSPLTRVHIIANRYVQPSNMVDDLRLPDLGVSLRGIWHGTNGYISDLRLGEEYQYVMRRQYATKYPGVMLPQPGLILNPWETRETENENQVAQAGDAPRAAAMPQGPFGEATQPWMDEQFSVQTMLPDYDFLADAGAMITNLRPDKDGMLSVPRDLIEGMPIVHVIAVDPLAVVRRTLYRELDKPDLADLRLARALDIKKAVAFARGVVIASQQQPLDLKSLGTAQIQTYSSIADLMRLYLTMQADERLKEFLPIANWHTLDDNGKREIYGRLACHELHLFLSTHDPKFFEQVIRAYLSNKAEKQFVDHYLLGDDLTPWTQLWRYRQLNAMEKILLARRVPSMKEVLRREFRELIAMRPDDPELLRRSIEFGLAGSAMSNDRLDRSLMLNESVDGLSANIGDSFGYAMADTADSSMAFSSPQVPGEFAKPQRRARGEVVREMSKAIDSDPFGRADKEGVFLGRRQSRVESFFQNLDSTKQWAESQWDRVRVNQANADLIAIDPFWLAIANSEIDSFALNEHLLRPIGSRHAVLAALALCGLPLEAGEVKLPVDDQPFAPTTPVAIVTKRMIELPPMDGEASLLVGQRFSMEEPDDRDPDVEVPVAPSEYLIHRVYRGEVILTNPTPQRKVVDVLWQIPAGGLPVAGGQATDSKSLTLEAFAVQRIQYAFYFPKAGDFVHYPVCVASDGKVVARGTERTFNVVAVPSKLDEESWPAVAAGGDAAKIDAFLAKANLRKIDLGLVAHRMKDRAIYDVVTKQLVANQIEKTELWGYSVYHRDIKGMKAFLSNQDLLVASTGPVFRGELLEIDPIDRRTYEFLEYSPLVQARIHRLKPQREILNPTFKEQYTQLIRVIAHQPQADAMQQLSLVYYKLLQNEIEEAIALFSRVDANQVDTKLQYDYLAGYLALHRGEYELARKAALTHENHPVPRWRSRFAAILSNLRQREQLMQGSGLVANQGTGQDGERDPNASGSADLSLIDRDRRNADAATSEPYVKVDVDGASLKIEHRNASKVVINLYAVDLELLFSKTPFVREDLATMAMVQPKRIETLELDSIDGVKQFRLADELARQTLLVEVVAGAARSTTLYYGGKLTAYVSQGFGQVQVSDSSTRQPVEAAYVKVYARHQDGSVSFYKDGYTDLRGRYDYASLSTGDLATVQRFAILVIDAERGATLQEAAPPNR
jgi:hypothetical protein